MANRERDEDTGNKQFWWIKLQEDFFESKEMKKLRRLAGGAVYTIIYLKMQLMTLKTSGRIYFDGIEDTFAEEIALTINESPDDVIAALMILERLGLAKRMNDEEILLPEVEKNTGSETKYAGKKRKYRAKIAAQKRAEIEVKGDNVLDVSSQCPTEIELEKEIEIESELERDNVHAREPYGSYLNVYLTDDEVRKLFEEIGEAYIAYIDNLSSYKMSTGKDYANDYATIRRWYKRDLKRGTEGQNDNEQGRESWNDAMEQRRKNDAEKRRQSEPTE